MGEVIESGVLIGWRAFKQRRREKRPGRSANNFVGMSVPADFYWECVGPLKLEESEGLFMVLTGKEIDEFIFES